MPSIFSVYCDKKHPASPTLTDFKSLLHFIPMVPNVKHGGTLIDLKSSPGNEHQIDWEKL